MQAAGQDPGKQGIAETQSRVPGRQLCSKPPEVWVEDAIYQDPTWKNGLDLQIQLQFSFLMNPVTALHSNRSPPHSNPPAPDQIPCA